MSPVPIGVLGGPNTHSYSLLPTLKVDALGLESELGAEAMRRQIEDARQAGTGVRWGGVRGSAASSRADVLGQTVDSRSVGQWSIGESCNDEEVGLFSRGWGKLKKLWGSYEAGVEVRGPRVSADPFCIDPNQVVRRTVSEEASQVIYSDTAQTLQNRGRELDEMINGPTGGGQ